MITFIFSLFAVATEHMRGRGEAASASRDKVQDGGSLRKV